VAWALLVGLLVWDAHYSGNGSHHHHWHFDD
jgi:hypothetical protein